MKILKNMIEVLTLPFISIAVMIDESRRINEDGSWNKYWYRKNKNNRSAMDGHNKGGD